jgi:hypothetical protein
VELHERQGAVHRLNGIKVFHDFPWTELFSDDRTQFRNGLSLARLVQEHCPENKRPALLLTRQSGVREGIHEHAQHHLVVVNIDRYLDLAGGNAATTYFGMLGSRDPIAAAAIDLSQFPVETVNALVQANLDPDLLRSWLRVDPQRASLLAEVLGECEGGIQAALSGHEPEAARVLVELLGDQAWTALLTAGMDMPAVLAYRRLWRERRVQCEEFRRHLDARDWIESNWQRFFESQTWIFGYGLRYQFLHQIAERPYIGGRDPTRSGAQEGDFLLSTSANVRFTVLVEIKRPDAELVMDRTYRNHVHNLGSELTGGVVQLQQQCWRWAVDGSRTDEARDLLEDDKIFTYEPRGILVIGDLASMAVDRDKIRSFECFRRSLKSPEVLTYDELFERAEQLVALGEAEVETPAEETAPPEALPDSRDP